MMAWVRFLSEDLTVDEFFSTVPWLGLRLCIISTPIYLNYFFTNIAQAVAVAALSAATGAIPIPGVGGAIDVILIGGTIMVYYRQFGLNNVTPEEQNLLKKNYRKVIQRYGFRQAADFTATIAPKTLGIIFGVEEVASFIPIIGIAIAGSISFAFTFRYLWQAINELEETAIAVWDNAAKQSVKDSLETRTNNLQLE